MKIGFNPRNIKYAYFTFIKCAREHLIESTKMKFVDFI